MALNPEDEQLLKETYQRLADRPLEPDDPLYENVYDREDGEDSVAKLRTHIEWAEIESLQLFSGFRGMGKTTELFRLRRQLEGQGSLVLYADALEYLSPSEEVDVVPMLMSVAGAFGEQASKISAVNALNESFWQRITNYLNKTTVEVTEVSGKVEGGLPAKELLGDLKAGLDMKLALKTAPSFRQKLQSFLANRLYELKAQVNAFIEEMVQQIRQGLGNDGLRIIFLFDQFEQLRGSRSNEQAVIKSVEQLFANHLDKLKLPYVHVIYTVPPWLQFVLPGAFSIETLPCVRLWNNDPERSTFEPGWRLMREVVAKRFGSDGFQRIFGVEGGGRALADKLIAMSGGHFRDLLRLFRETLVLTSSRQEALPVSAKLVDRAIVNVRNEFISIAIDDARWLRQISHCRGTALPASSPDNIGRLSRFLDTHLVLYLTNGEDWYDIHPLIREKVDELARPFPA